MKEELNKGKETEKKYSRSDLQILNAKIEDSDGKIIKIKEKGMINPKEYEQYQKDYKLYQKIKKKGVGYAFDNYKQMCKELGLPYKTGEAKQIQMEDLKRFCVLDKPQGKKSFTIEKINANIKEKIDKRNKIYISLIEMLLLWSFQQIDEKNKKLGKLTEDSYIKEFTKSQLFLMLGMINENFLFKNRDSVIQQIVEDLLRKEEDKAQRKLSETEMELKAANKTKEIQAFLLRVNTLLTNILNNSLKSLEKRYAINYEKAVIIITEEGKKHEASEKERRTIDDYKIQILQKMGYQTGTKNVYFLPEKKREEFDRKYAKKIKEEQGWEYTYTVYKINHTQKYLESMINTVEKDLDKRLKESKLSLNKKVIEAVNRGEEKEKAKQEEKRKTQEIEIAGKRIIPTGNPEYIKVVQKSFPMTTEIKKVQKPYGEDFIETHKQYAKTFLEINDIETNKDFIYKQEDIKELVKEYGLEDCIMTKEVTEEEIADILFSGMFEEESEEKEK